jgi:hypothetical protein
MGWVSHLAKILGVNRAAVSKLQADMYVSTLQGFAKAMERWRSTSLGM